MTVELRREEVLKCMDFAESAWKMRSQSQKHFGGSGRTQKQFIADQIEGKLAECIFLDFLKEKGKETTLDFNHYEGELNTDSGDLVFLREGTVQEAPVDIKGTSHFAQWLLVEDYKFFDLDTRLHKSEAFVLVAFGDSFPGNRALREEPDIILNRKVFGKCRGWAKAEDFYADDNEHWFSWRRGDRPWHERTLPKTFPYNRRGLDRYLEKSISGCKAQGKSTRISIPLDAELNHGLPVKWLRTDWDEFITEYIE